MKRILFTALAALFLALAAEAQQISGPSDFASGNLVSTNDAVTVGVLGSRWGTVKFSVTVGGSTTVVAEMSIDGANNWIAAPFGKRNTHISANPQVAAVAGPVTTGDIWEIPLPANVTNFRLRANPGGTVTTVVISGGQPYAPGTPITAVLYDTTSASATALDTGTIETAGWTLLTFLMTMSGGTPAFSTQEVDDAGVSSANVNTWAVATYGGYGAGTNPGVGVTAGLAGTSNIQLSKRMRFQSAVIAVQTSRIRIEARR